MKAVVYSDISDDNIFLVMIIIGSFGFGFNLYFNVAV